MDILPLLRLLPKGKITTYGDLAKATQQHPRTIAAQLKTNTRPEFFPCYKVVHTSRTIGGYSALGGCKQKEALLLKEGVILEEGKVSTASIIPLQELVALLKRANI